MLVSLFTNLNKIFNSHSRRMLLTTKPNMDKPEQAWATNFDAGRQRGGAAGVQATPQPLHSGRRGQEGHTQETCRDWSRPI